MPAYGTCLAMLLLCNAMVWYPHLRWAQSFPARFFSTRNARTVELSLAWAGVAGAACISVALSLILASTYATDRYLRILGTHCGATTANGLGSLSAMFAEEPNMIFWRLGMMGAMPLIVLTSNVLFFAAAKPRSRWRLPAFLLGSLENAALAVLTAVSSRENHGLHVGATSCWFASSLLYVACTCADSIVNHSNSGGHGHAPRDRLLEAGEGADAMLVTASAGNICEFQQAERLRHRLWLQCAGVHLAAGAVAIVAYIVHNAYCWSYAYSAFGAAELVLVASSVALRCIGALETRSTRVTVSIG